MPRVPSVSTSWFRPVAAALVVALWLGLSSGATAAGDDEAAAAIRAVMNDSAAAWSAGDLDAFMQTYEDSPDTLFVGAQGVVRGKAAIAARYAATFGSGGPGRLGALTFETIELRPLGPDHALMIGRYRLQPPDAAKPPATGIFSLVFHRRDGRWRIVCDHTS